MSLQILLAWFAIHFFCWLIQAGVGDVSMAGGACEGFMCNTPMRDFVDRDQMTGLDQDPTIADIFLVTIVWDVIIILKDWFTFNYEFLDGRAHGVAHDLIGATLRFVGTVGSTVTLLALLKPLFQGRRLGF